MNKSFEKFLIIIILILLFVFSFDFVLKDNKIELTDRVCINGRLYILNDSDVYMKPNERCI